jgi:uncharacterized protein (TIGR02217 family)
MADFDQALFPPKVSLNAVGGPGFNTSIVTMASGKESRRRWWEQDRGSWVVSHHARLHDPVGQELLAFFRTVAQGMGNTFRFKDWTDFVCATGSGLFQPSTFGSPTGVQMVKRYSFRGLDGTTYTHDRVINKPRSGTITTNAVGLDYATGIATSGTTWSGEFDCWVRLNSDVMRLQVLNRHGDNDESGRPELIVGWDGIELVEVIEEEAP